jgi:putative acetyltransferase
MIRRYRIGEEKELRDIFFSSVQENAVGYYSQAQLSAWASEDNDFELWKMRIKHINPFVLVENDKILAYADLQTTGYIDHFFIRGGHAHKGLGSILMTHIINQAKKDGMNELSSNVSLAAQRFFSKFGFKIVKRKEVNIKGINIENALMTLDLNDR